MKSILFLSIITTSLFSRSQNIYGSISGGYLYNSKNDQPTTYIVNTYHQISLPWFWRQEDYSFKNSLHVDFRLGHMVTKNFGYELSGGYLKPISVSDNNEFGKRIMNGNFIQTSGKVILSIPVKQFDIYTKLGLNMALGKMTYLQTIDDGNFNSSGISVASLEYEYKGPLSLGFNGTLGMNIPISRKLSFFTEVGFSSQVFSPKNGKMIAYSINGTDQLANNDYDPYYSQIEFGDDSEWYYWNSDDPSQAQKLYKRNYSLGGYGLTVGFKFILWTKKKGESELP
jgi:hypothetical protein